MSNSDQMVPPQEWYAVQDMHSLRSLQRSLLAEGRVLLDLSMVNPDLAPPRILTEQLARHSGNPVLHRYSSARGIARLREAFVDRYRKFFGAMLDSDLNVCVTEGVKEGLLSLLRVLADRTAQRNALVISPTYPAHLAALRLTGWNAVTVSLNSSILNSQDPENPGSQVDEQALLAAIKRTQREANAKVCILNFPHNPTGVSVSQAFWSELREFGIANDMWLINDFAYGELVYRRSRGGDRSGLQKAASLLAGSGVSLGCCELFTLSKAFQIPGWRIGALLGDAEIVRSVAALKGYTGYGGFLPMQLAAAHALTLSEDLTAPFCEAYSRRAEVLSQGLRQLGWQVAQPLAGASVWCRVPEQFKGWGSKRVAEWLLREVDLVVQPGYVYGAEQDEFVRFALVADEHRLRSLLTRLREALGTQLLHGKLFESAPVFVEAGAVHTTS
jgi:alanine-synthesizing transaminase